VKSVGVNIGLSCLLWMVCNRGAVSYYTSLFL